MRVVGFYVLYSNLNAKRYISAEGGRSKGGTDEIFKNIKISFQGVFNIFILNLQNIKISFHFSYLSSVIQ